MEEIVNKYPVGIQTFEKLESNALILLNSAPSPTGLSRKGNILSI